MTKFIAISLDVFLNALAKREGLITSEQCECRLCTAERAADLLDTSLETTESEARTGDELVNAFIRGFNFKAAGEPLCESQPFPDRPKPIEPLGAMELFTILLNHFPTMARTQWEDVLGMNKMHYERMAMSINNRFGVKHQDFR